MWTTAATLAQAGKLERGIRPHLEKNGRWHPRDGQSGGTACLTLLVQHTVSSKVANTYFANYGEPRHDETRVKRTRP